MDDFYRDILIEQDDISLDAGRQPLHATGRACIAQDILHMVRESGLLIGILGERADAVRKTALVRITLKVDKDYRIRPGTTRVEEVWKTRTRVEFWLTAETLRYGRLSLLLAQEEVL